MRRVLGVEINEKRVRRLMKLDGLIASRKTVRRCLSHNHGFPRYPNLPAELVPTAIKPTLGRGSDIRLATLDVSLPSRGS